MPAFFLPSALLPIFFFHSAILSASLFFSAPYSLRSRMPSSLLQCSDSLHSTNSCSFLHHCLSPFEILPDFYFSTITYFMLSSSFYSATFFFLLATVHLFPSFLWLQYLFLTRVVACDLIPPFTMRSSVIFVFVLF